MLMEYQSIRCNYEKAIIKILDIFLLLSGVIIFILAAILNTMPLYVIAFGECFCAIVLILIINYLMPFLYKTYPMIKARLSDPILLLYARISINTNYNANLNICIFNNC